MVIREDLRREKGERNESEMARRKTGHAMISGQTGEKEQEVSLVGGVIRETTMETLLGIGMFSLI